MLDTLTVARANLKEYGDNFAVVASPKGRYAYSLITAPIFLMAVVAEIGVVYKTITLEDYSATLTVHLLFSGIALLFGYLSFSNLKALIQLNEVLLLPEKRKIVLRRERSKKVVSEHSIDDIRLEGEKVLWDNAVNYTKFFTIYDTRSNKQIFSIRPGTNAVNSAGACNELEEFFNEVMRPEKRKDGS